MTDHDHRIIGAALGMPSCCVEAFIVSIRREQPCAVIRGSYTLGITHERPEGLPAWWGRNDDGTDAIAGTDNVYVPCAACLGGPGWSPRAYSDPDEARRVSAKWTPAMQVLA